MKQIKKHLKESENISIEVVSSVVFDKTHSAKTDDKGNVSYKPKRDENGVIICKSDLDKETNVIC